MLQFRASFQSGCVEWAAKWLIGLAVALSPVTVIASCGDYLELHTVGLSPWDHSRDDGPKQIPCHGPNCRQSVPAAPLLPLISVTTAIEEGVEASVAHLEFPAPSRKHFSNQLVQRLDGYPGRLEKPPQNKEWVVGG